ncbi:MAG: hypothetical protein ACLQBY_05640 [Solirubrobacteraceae bacterium]
MTEERSYPKLIGQAFVTCAGAEYANRDGQVSLLTGMLIDAAHPGVTPGPLPGMKGLDGHPGAYEAEAEGGDIVAKRIADAWLFVASGPFTKADVGLATRLALLTQLRGVRY